MEKQLQISQANQQTAKLISSIAETGSMAIVSAASNLTPNGIPDFERIKYFPSIVQLKHQHGPANLHKLIMILIKNYCNSVNVPEGKNMNEDQIIEAAGYLLDECGNFRIEDYVIMFSLAKRGKLKVGDTGRIFDRVDIQLISDFKANYEALRAEEGYKIQERELRRIELGDPEPETGDSKKQRENFNKAMDLLKKQLAEMGEIRDQESQKRKDLYQKRKEELFVAIQHLAVKNGYNGSLIDLSPFKNK